MRPPFVLALAVIAMLLTFPHLVAPPVPARAPQRKRPALSAAVVHAGLRFAPDVAPADRQVVLNAIAVARPEARGLVTLVDGLVTVEVGPVSGDGPDVVGLTSSTSRGFLVQLDLGRVWREAGQRGTERLVLHELGHVVDHALVSDKLRRALDAQIPAGYGCDPGQPTGACAPVPERFAETFAKWASGDLGFNLYLGYKVPPPDSMEAWGTDLVRGVASG